MVWGGKIVRNPPVFLSNYTLGVERDFLPTQQDYLKGKQHEHIYVYEKRRDYDTLDSFTDNLRPKMTYTYGKLYLLQFLLGLPRPRVC